jgi:hypothetical protein
MWATPNVPSGGRVIPDDATWSGKAAYTRDGTKRQVDLANQVLKWPTPTSGDSNGHQYQWDHGQKGKERPMLPGMVAGWPTPAARDAKGANGERHFATKDRPHADQLANAVLISGRPRPDRNMDGNRLEPCNILAPASPVKLNPDWEETLMGLPVGWTRATRPCGRDEFLRWETASCRLLQLLRI